MFETIAAKLKMAGIIMAAGCCFLTGCGKSEEKVYTYDDLTVDGKRDVDTVYAERDRWEMMGEDVCRVVMFVEDNGDIVFVSGYPYGDVEYGYTETGTGIGSTKGLGKRVYKVKDNSMVSYPEGEKLGLPVSFYRNYNIDGSEMEKKNALANMYYNQFLWDEEKELAWYERLGNQAADLADGCLDLISDAANGV